MWSKHICLLLLMVIIGIVHDAQGYLSKRELTRLRHTLRRLLIQRRQACENRSLCRSKWGYCGTGPAYCGKGCKGGPCTNGGANNHGTGDNIINEQTFACAFDDLDSSTRAKRLDGLRNSGWKPVNKDEAAVFLAHVYHETDGLKTLKEYCAPGCGHNYDESWCDVQPVSGKVYYGRGWLQLSYPCNYDAAGKALGVNLLKNPDLVEQQQDLAVKTAVWFYQTNKMNVPAQQGDFAATIRIINGPVECGGGQGAANQQTRVATYKRIRKCFGLGDPTINPTC